MRGVFISFFGLWLILSACQTIVPETQTPTLVPSLTTTSSATPHPTSTATPLVPTSTVLPATPTQITPQVQLDFEIRTHPDAGLFVGDQISFEVIPLSDFDLENQILRIYSADKTDPPMESNFAPFGIAGRQQATLYWDWDTTGLEAGAQPLTFAIQPLGYTWTQTVTLGLADDVPPPEPLAHWVTSESECCVFYYISETAAAREITATLALADQQAAHAIEALGGDFTEPLVVTLMPRVLGQGGFASNEIYTFFLDRNYAGNNLEMVLHHEMVHLLDRRLGGELRPSILVEGLAVYLTGGHYKPEALIPRAAALLAPTQRADGLGLDWYIPLRELVDDFYQSQHEIGYIQAGALVAYLVDTWGWEAYSNFYRDIQPIASGSQSDALDAALQTHFGLTLEELEHNFVEILKEQPITSETIADMQLTVSFFEVMRRYQQALDPSAYFLTAWLPDGPVMRERGITADLLRRPSSIENLALETLLVSADQAMEEGDFEAAAEALEAVSLALDAMAAGNPDAFGIHPLANAYFEIAQLAWRAGYYVERIAVDNQSARVIASQGWPDLTVFEFGLVDGHWILVGSQ